jgi:predicted alpha/beta superfamily hydrolase
MRPALTALLAAAFALALSPARAEPLKVVSETPAPPPGYTRLVVHSDRIGRDFVVTVNAPGTIVFLPGQKLPAIYALDGGLEVAGPQGQLLSTTSAMEPAIVVSVGYLPGKTPLRNIDLFHNKLTQNGATFGDGGAAFEAFLLEDLKPFIEARYPADPSRSVLFGHSAGGLFAANVFADKPDAFYGYIIGSAAAWADPTLFARVAAAAPRAHGRRVYLAVGEKEGAGKPGGGATMTDGFNGLMKALKGHPGVILKTRVYKGETHASYYPRLVLDAFPFVLPPGAPLGGYQARLPDATLAKYVGDYRLNGQLFSITTDKDGALYGHVPGIPPIGLLQNGTDRFFTATVDANITFDATGATLSGVDGGTLRAERVKPAP